MIWFGLLNLKKSRIDALTVALGILFGGVFVSSAALILYRQFFPFLIILAVSVICYYIILELVVFRGWLIK
jgi:hypothetical protein